MRFFPVAWTPGAPDGPDVLSHLVVQAKKKLEQERKKAAEKKDVASKQPQEKRCLPSEGLRGLILNELPDELWPESFYSSYCFTVFAFFLPTAGLNDARHGFFTRSQLEYPVGQMDVSIFFLNPGPNPLVKQELSYLATKPT